VPSLLIPMFDYLVSPGGSNEKLTLYCGIVDAAELHGIHGLQQEGEDIRLHKLKFTSAVQEINGGHINNAATIMAIQWLELHKSSVLETWNLQAEQ
jgi:ADP-ribose pyrophosphatase